MPGIQSRLEDHKFTVRTTAWSAEVRKRLTVKLNGEQKKALRMALDEGQNVFFTGAAGAENALIGDPLIRSPVGSSIRNREVDAARRDHHGAGDEIQENTNGDICDGEHGDGRV